MAGGKHILGKGNARRVFGKTETGLIVTIPETRHDLAKQIFHSVENEE